MNLNRFPLWWWGVAILLLTFWLGARSLTADSIWFDEFRAIQDAGGGFFERRNPLEIWNGVAERHGVHPPGFYIALSGWGALTGWQPPILRTLSLFAGVLTVAWTYRLGRNLLSAHGGLYAAAVVGTSSLFVYYLHEVRMYTLLALFTIMILWHYLYIMNPQSRPRVWHWAGLFTAAVGALYTQYFAITLLGAIGVYHLLFTPLYKRWRPVVFVMLLAGLLFVPWLLSGVTNGIDTIVEDETLHQRAFSTQELVQRILTVFSNDSLLLLALAGAAAAFALVRRRRSAVTLWYFAIAVLVLIIGVNLVLQLLYERRIRYTIPMWPLLALLVSLGMVAIERWSYKGMRVGRVVARGLLAAWMVNGVGYILSGSYTFPVFPFHLAADALRDQMQANDTILTIGDYGPVDGLNAHRMVLRFYLDPIPFEAGLLVTNPANERIAEAQNRLMQSLTDEPRSNLWLLYKAEPQPENLASVRALLDEHHAQCTTDIGFSGAHIQEYAASPICCSTERNASDPMLRYANGISLLKLEPLPEAFSGGTLRVASLWHVPPDVPPNTYSVSLQVYDEAHVKVAQADYALDSLTYTCSSVPLELPALDTGDYTLEAVVYAWETGERITGTRSDDGTQSDLQRLGAFHAAP